MNKYDIYVNKNELSKFIKDNNIKDERKFRNSGDFEHVYDSYIYAVNYFDKDGFINGWTKDNFLEFICDFGEEVSPEEFLIAIGYLPEKQETKIKKINPDDIHYICESGAEDNLSVSLAPLGDIYIQVGNNWHVESVRLSPEGLIQLGSDLVKLGVQLRDSE